MPEGGRAARGVVAAVDEDEGEDDEGGGGTDTNCEPHGMPWPKAEVWWEGEVRERVRVKWKRKWEERGKAKSRGD